MSNSEESVSKQEADKRSSSSSGDTSMKSGNTTTANSTQNAALKDTKVGSLMLSLSQQPMVQSNLHRLGLRKIIQLV